MSTMCCLLLGWCLGLRPLWVHWVTNCHLLPLQLRASAYVQSQSCVYYYTGDNQIIASTHKPRRQNHADMQHPFPQSPNYNNRQYHPLYYHGYSQSSRPSSAHPTHIPHRPLLSDPLNPYHTNPCSVTPTHTTSTLTQWPPTHSTMTLFQWSLTPYLQHTPHLMGKVITELEQLGFVGDSDNNKRENEHLLQTTLTTPSHLYLISAHTGRSTQPVKARHTL